MAPKIIKLIQAYLFHDHKRGVESMSGTAPSASVGTDSEIAARQYMAAHDAFFRSLIATAKASAKLSIWHHFLHFRSFLWFDRAAGFPSPRPQDADADAHRSCQGWPLFAATEGLAFT